MIEDQNRQADANVIFLPKTHSAKEFLVMDRINQHLFYDLGKTVGFLSQHQGEQIDSYDILLDLISIRSKFQALLEKGEPYPISISRKIADEVLTTVQALFTESTTVVDQEGNKSFSWPSKSMILIDGWKVKQLHSTISRFETIFGEEMREAAVYSIPKRGIFSTDLLLNNAVQTFPAKIIPNLPEKTKADWKSAGRCMALGLFSASGFHVARAVEGTVEAYYQVYSSNPGKTLKSWNDYIDAIEKIVSKSPTPCPRDKTLAELKQMKDDYRNPLMHPRVDLDEADAKILFNNGESLIICMIQEICDVRTNSIQPSLALVAPATGTSP